MSQSEQKVVQYLGEAHASEVGLVSVLQSQIAITPRGSYREGLDKRAGQTVGGSRRDDLLVDRGHESWVPAPEGEGGNLPGIHSAATARCWR